jgi:hypothetical protein
MTREQKPHVAHRWWHRKKAVGWGDGGTWYVCKNKRCHRHGRAFAEGARG